LFLYSFFSYKLASAVRRSNYIHANDPAARDNNGYISGTYYVGVFGYCTPNEFVVDPETDGPCYYALHTYVNVTVQLASGLLCLFCFVLFV
jgi:hypothetical protein